MSLPSNFRNPLTGLGSPDGFQKDYPSTCCVSSLQRKNQQCIVCISIYHSLGLIIICIVPITHANSQSASNSYGIWIHPLIPFKISSPHTHGKYSLKIIFLFIWKWTFFLSPVAAFHCSGKFVQLVYSPQFRIPQHTRAHTINSISDATLPTSIYIHICYYAHFGANMFVGTINIGPKGILSCFRGTTLCFIKTKSPSQT